MQEGREGGGGLKIGRPSEVNDLAVGLAETHHVLTAPYNLDANF